MRLKQTWTMPNPDLEHTLIATLRRSLAFQVQTYLFGKHKIRASLKADDEFHVLEYHPLPDGPTIEEARAIATAYLTGVSAIQIPEKS